MRARGRDVCVKEGGGRRVREREVCVCVFDQHSQLSSL